MFILTFDTDWAPQFVLDSVLDKVAQAGLKATCFCTGPYAGLDRDGIEVGLHPNLMADSTQGNGEEDVMAAMCALFPEARGVRTHRLFWHGNMYGLLDKHGIRYDSSMLLPLQPGVVPSRLGSLVRFPIWWSERVHQDREYDMGDFDFPELGEAGLKVLLFHPIHVYLNSMDVLETQRVLSEVGSLERVGRERLEPYRNEGKGFGRVFEACLDRLSSGGESVATFSEIVESCP